MPIQAEWAEGSELREWLLWSPKKHQYLDITEGTVCWNGVPKLAFADPESAARFRPDLQAYHELLIIQMQRPWFEIRATITYPKTARGNDRPAAPGQWLSSIDDTASHWVCEKTSVEGQTMRFADRDKATGMIAMLRVLPAISNRHPQLVGMLKESMTIEYKVRIKQWLRPPEVTPAELSYRVIDLD